MRTIKFRAWDKKKKEMIVPDAIVNPLEGFPNYEHMQFTGLLDKNGKEIYEGDVVKIHNFKITWKHGEPKIDWRIFEVRWNRYLWSFHNSVISKPLADYDTSNLEPYQIEVIGNVYSNPELLKS